MIVRLVTILFILISFFSFGQYMPMNSSFSTPRGTINTINHIRIPIYNNYSKVAKVEMRYTIVLKNDSMFSVPSTIKLNDTIDFLSYTKNILEKKSPKVRVYPNQTKELRIKTSEGMFTGIPKDSCWLFKTVRGKINGYSHLPIVAYEEIVAIQKGSDGEIIALSKSTVLSMVMDHEKATALVNKDKLWKAIKEYNKNK